MIIDSCDSNAPLSESIFVRLSDNNSNLKFECYFALFQKLVASTCQDFTNNLILELKPVLFGNLCLLEDP